MNTNQLELSEVLRITSGSARTELEREVQTAGTSCVVFTIEIGTNHVVQHILFFSFLRIQ
jgi:hypothetical protein